MNCTVTITRVADGVSVTYSTDTLPTGCDCNREAIFYHLRGEDVPSDDGCTFTRFTFHVQYQERS